MKRITVEQQIENEVKRMIFENGEEESKAGLEDWNEMKNMIGRSTTTFVSSFISTLIPALLFCTVILGIILYFILR